MCGICFVCSSTTIKSLSDSTDATVLHHRGPDCMKQHSVVLANQWNGLMQGYVLRLRGQLTPQPMTDNNNNALLWNGEIFGGIKVTDEENDTQVLFASLKSCISDEDILNTLQSIQGPWALVYWQATRRKLWFGRDIFGRRSLLWHLPVTLNDNFILSSVSLECSEFTELPSVGVFCLEFSHCEDSTMTPRLTLHPWNNCVWPGTTQQVKDTPDDIFITKLFSGQDSPFPVTLDSRNLISSWIPQINDEVPGTAQMIELPLLSTKDKESSLHQVLEQALEQHGMDSLAESLLTVLEESVKRRVCNTPTEPTSRIVRDFESACNERNVEVSKARLSILFSGGLDSTVLAALADRCLPIDEPIDLLNVAFEQDVQKPHPKKNKSRVKREKCYYSTDDVSPPVCEAADPVHGSHKEGSYPDPQQADNSVSLEQPMSQTSAGSDDLSQRMGKMSGFSTNGPHLTSPYNSSCINKEDHSPSISPHFETSQLLTGEDQSNVFQDEQFCVSLSDANDSVSNTEQGSTHESRDVNGLVNKLHAASAEPIVDLFNVPDRQTGLIALEELNPHRRWNFVEINVSQVELKMARESHIKQLILPLQTVLDDSIGCAVWFAARGLGTLRSNRQPFHSTARVVLCGMAADEQFAGYSRHRVTFQKAGWPGLVAELREEMWRISARNLGRDDRIITDHGKEARFPFLDENVTKFISEIPVHQRANLHYPRGVGEKLLLRVAALKLGLKNTACQPKRAIQFGSKIAKLDNKREKGSDVCTRLS